MLWDHRQLKRDIAQQHQRVLAARVAFNANTGSTEHALRRRLTAPRTLGYVFLGGLVYGLIGQRRLLPSGLSWVFWQSASSLLLGFLSRSLDSVSTAASAPKAE